MQRLIIFTILVAIQIPLCGQDIDNNKNIFLSASVKKPLNKKTSLKFGYMVALESNNQDLRFTQFKVGVSRKLSKKISTDFYYKPMLFKGNTRDIWYQRLSATVHHSSKLFEKPMKNSLAIEFFFPKLRKYQYRIVYSLKYSFKNKVLPLRTTPYLKGQLFYYHGGKPLSYYDDSGENLLARQAPNGLHRYRLSGGIRFRPLERYYVTLFYTIQKEFNTNIFENRQLHVPSKNGSRIKYPFNDYQVFGLSLYYSIKRKRKNK